MGIQDLDMKKLFWAIIFSLVALNIYFFIIAPFVPKISIIEIHDNEFIENLKIYYGAIYPISTVFISTIGVFLGFYYYINKNEIEDKRKANDRHYKFIETVMENINDMSENACKIMHNCIGSSQELEVCRSRLMQSDDYLETLLYCAENVYEWESDEYLPIMKFRSFISNSNFISHFSFDDIKSKVNSRFIIIEKHKESLNSAKHACFLKIEKIYS